MSGADSERPASGTPRPPVGTGPLHWSPDVKQRYFQSRETLRDEVDTLALRAAGNPAHLAEPVRLQRVLTVRSAVYRQSRTHLFAERVRGLFDEGVELARRPHRYDDATGSRALATALTDRATFHAAAEEFAAARDGFLPVCGVASCCCHQSRSYSAGGTWPRVE
ncbi:hypothetical protein [Streptomyces sp. P9-A2]|uniref:hypothetical protein n=1 Tax=Streptomyces sp. P9-A2 TaxID=3072284 RepID=UPI002FCB63BE